MNKKHSLSIGCLIAISIMATRRTPPRQVQAEVVEVNGYNVVAIDTSDEEWKFFADELHKGQAVVLVIDNQKTATLKDDKVIDVIF